MISVCFIVAQMVVCQPKDQAMREIQGAIDGLNIQRRLSGQNQALITAQIEDLEYLQSDVELQALEATLQR